MLERGKKRVKPGDMGAVVGLEGVDLRDARREVTLQIKRRHKKWKTT